MWQRLQPYKSSIILLLALFLGSAVGIFFPDFAIKLQPFGQIFLNFLFMIIVPLVSVGVMSSIAGMGDVKKLGRIMGILFAVTTTMALISALYMLGLTRLFDPSPSIAVTLPSAFDGEVGKMDFVHMLTTSDFVGLLSKSNILALIIMSILSGIAISQSGEQGRKIADLLAAANTVILRIVAIIMKAAPIGLGCYFAATMASQDSKLFVTFARAIALLFGATLFYYFVGSTIYAWIAGGREGGRKFWKYIIEPSATACGTCSSLGSLPSVMRAANNIGVDKEIVDITVPVLMNVNKSGSAMGVALKIVFIFAVLGLPFTTSTFFATLLIAVLAAMVIGGIPGGAFLGEIFIATTLGLPMETIPMLIIIGTLGDVPLTLLNVVHNVNAVQLIERFVGKKKVKEIA